MRRRPSTSHGERPGTDPHALRRNQPCRHLDLGLPDPRTMRKSSPLLETPGGYFAAVVPEDQYSIHSRYFANTSTFLSKFTFAKLFNCPEFFTGYPCPRAVTCCHQQPARPASAAWCRGAGWLQKASLTSPTPAQPWDSATTPSPWGSNLSSLSPVTH